ncbi:MAG TPA: alpha-ketoglutarate-dependent dioxygenase AlkB [Puia sp.]|nr:alpha-ketoglutarate-dependent dioxygenase AlkB [Puia sp.]
MSLFGDTDLFTVGKPRIVRYDLPDAELTLYEGFFPKNEADRLYTALLKETSWKQENITVYDKTHLTPRLTAWHGDAHTAYTFSGSKWEPYPWNGDLLFIKEKVEKETGKSFNSVLLNLYRNGKDSVGWHRDNEKEFGRNPAIASVSFGETRPFQIRHKFRKEVEKVEIPLTHGSLLLMAGPMQHFWEHQVPKTARPIHPRINLTFRLVHPPATGPAEP